MENNLEYDNIWISFFKWKISNIIKRNVLIKKNTYDPR